MAILTRVLVAYRVMRGTLEVETLTEQLQLHRDLVERLYKVIDRVQTERQYWHELWNAEGREYHAAQHRLIDEITNLRRKNGDATADKMRELELFAERQRHELLVAPAHHPTPAIKTPLEHIDCPPTTFKDG